MKTITLTEDELWLLIETLDSWRDSIEHLKDEAYEQSLEELETKLREVLK